MSNLNVDKFADQHSFLDKCKVCDNFLGLTEKQCVNWDCSNNHIRLKE